MNIRFLSIALMVIAASVSYAVAGFNLPTQMAVATLVASIALMVLPNVSMSVSFGQLARCDDPVEVLSEKLREAMNDLKIKQRELKDQGDEYKSQLGTATTEFKRTLDENIVTVTGLQTTVAAVEQKLQELAQEGIKSRENAPEKVKSYGEQFGESDAFKAFKERRFTGAAHFEAKAITTVGAGGLNRQPYQDTLVSLERQRLTIRDLLTVIPVQEGSIEYAKQNLRTNNAAPVAEGAAKPYSDYGWTTATAPIRVIAHLAKITRQAAADAPRLMAEVDSELRYGLDIVEEAQILNGNGTDQNLNGINPQATPFALPAGATMPDNATQLDVLRLAVLQNALAIAPADGIVLNPVDWTMIELLKDANNAYLFANIQGTIGPVVWGKRVVETPAQLVGDFLVGAFKYGANLYDRMTIEVLLSSENTDDFEKNMLTLRAEKRIGLGVRRPYAFTKGDFATILTP